MTEIFRVEGDADPRCDIQKAADADGGVHGEAGDRFTGPLDLSLQDVVREGNRKIQIHQEIVDAVTGGLGHYVDIGLCNRLHHRLIELLVEVEDFAVGRLVRIVGPGDVLRGAAGQQDDGAGKQNGCKLFHRSLDRIPSPQRAGIKSVSPRLVRSVKLKQL